MLTRKQLVTILDEAYDTMQESKVRNLAGGRELVKSFVYGQLVAYMITAEEVKGPQQLNG